MIRIEEKGIPDQKPRQYIKKIIQNKFLNLKKDMLIRVSWMSAQTNLPSKTFNHQR